MLQCTELGECLSPIYSKGNLIFLKTKSQGKRLNYCLWTYVHECILVILLLCLKLSSHHLHCRCFLKIGIHYI